MHPSLPGSRALATVAQSVPLGTDLIPAIVVALVLIGFASALIVAAVRRKERDE
ncbi:hypothetical protein [Herbiconiux sp. L3-i23]|uniref:hypothetical protein n=1 Tax=Herbiconiux sp. L3-i23 TaxID=2905871 RepID=UPI00206C44FB|nr:hypothetical protein [Herbiconiux sp. L3-i23]BDI23375.1 hypothetical protein L3i23_21510 [Herbiconiux sp. L3-i23]